MSDLLRKIPGAIVKKLPLRKVSVVGVGSVGMATVFSMMCKEVANTIALIDVFKDLVKGEVMDLQQGTQFVKNMDIIGGSDYCASANSDVIIVTAGARQKEGESRLNLVQRNVDIYKNIIPELVKYSPETILVIVSNPVDIMTHVATKLSKFPPNRVVGTGCILDTARFRYFIGQKLGISPNSVHGYIIGEHGDSSVPVWSKVNLAGTHFSATNPDIGTDVDPQNYNDVHGEVVKSAYEIIKLKGYTSWAIGLSTCALASAILNDQKTIFPLSVNLNGMYGVEEDVYLSLPALVDASGVQAVIPPPLSCQEKSKLLESARSLLVTMKTIKY